MVGASQVCLRKWLQNNIATGYVPLKFVYLFVSLKNWHQKHCLVSFKYFIDVSVCVPMQGK